ncbi:MAG: cell division protein ZapA [Alphaproteobacteria bacterium]|nr:cell division protein ZapA [Alphaproteobacteria bacterium SS10]
MARVEVSINHRKYPIVCDDGQEGRVQELATFVDSRAQQIANAAPGSSDSIIMALTTLMVADELFEERRTGGDGPSKADKAEADNQAGQAIEAVEYLTRRVAAIADSLQAD